MDALATPYAQYTLTILLFCTLTVLPIRICTGIESGDFERYYSLLAQFSSSDGSDVEMWAQWWTETSPSVERVGGGRLQVLKG